MGWKHVFIFVVIAILIGVLANFLIEKINQPKLTDPVAQRIWAAKQGINYNASDVIKIIKEATFADSVLKDKTK